MKHLFNTGEHLIEASKEFSLFLLRGCEKMLKKTIDIIDNRSKETKIEEEYENIVPKDFDRTYWTVNENGDMVEVDDEN